MLHAELQEEQEFQEEEEFQEADILWPDAADFQESPFSRIGIDDADDDSGSSRGHQAPLKLQVRQKAASSPIDIPGRKVVVGATAARGTAGAPAGSRKLFGASHAGVIGSHVFVPPHVIVDRRAKREKAMMMLMVPSQRARARKMRE